jgi:hypothetical protein
VAASPYDLNFSNIPAGVYPLTAQATDNQGAVGISPPVVFTVLAANSPPLITTQPQSESVFLGTNTGISVQAYGGPPLSYQWQLNGTNLPGATSALLSLTNAQLPSAGIYDVVVTNQYGRVTSASANLTLVSPNLFFNGISTTTNGNLQRTISAPAGSSFRIQTSADLANWTTLAQLTATNQNMSLSYPVAPQTTRLFYRLAAP